MARFDAGMTNVGTAGTAVQVNNSTDRVVWARFKARASNTGGVYVGLSDVSSTNGWELTPTIATTSYGVSNAPSERNTEGLILDFREMGKQGSPGSCLVSDFYVDAAVSGDDVDWVCIYEH